MPPRRSANRVYGSDRRLRVGVPGRTMSCIRYFRSIPAKRLAMWVRPGAVCVMSLLLAAAGKAEAPRPVRVLIQTDKGDVEVELDAAKAPVTVANFLRYVDAKFYDGGQFHRTVRPDNQPANKVKIEVVQAGIDPKRAK